MSVASLELNEKATSIAPGNMASLTGVRFLAALTIALGHTYHPADVITMIGMPLFFTLSGFIIHYVYSDTFATGWRKAAISFAGARFSRIYPLYAVFLAVSLVITPMGKILYHSGNIKLILAYAFACYTWFPFSIDDHATTNWYYDISWSVPTEIFFYVCYMLVFYRFQRIRSAKLCFGLLIGFCIAAYLLFYGLFLTRDIWESIALRHFSGFLPREASFNDSLYRWFLYSSPYGRVLEFIGGCLTCQLFLLVRENSALRGRLNFEVLTWGSCALIAVAVIAFQHLGPVEPWLSPHNHRLLSFFVSLHMNFMIAPLCYVLIFALAYGRSTLSQFLSCGFVVLLGEISYSTYLGHPLAQRFFDNSALSDLPYAPTLIEMLVIYLFSWMFYVSLEVPAKAGLRRFFARRPPRIVANLFGRHGAWAGVVAAAILATLWSTHMLGGDHGNTADAAPSPANAALAALPVLQPISSFAASWDGMQGLELSPLKGSAAVPEGPWRLVVKSDNGRHRLGIAAHGLKAGSVYRISAWVRAAAAVPILLDMRDGKATHFGSVMFKLPADTVAGHKGDVADPGVAHQADGWTKISAEMTFADDTAVIYVTLLDASGADQYTGDGTTAVDFGGLEITQSQ